MKRLLLLACIVLITISCFSQSSNSYTIKGTLHKLDLNDERIDLVELGEHGNSTIQDTRVANNAFSFTGTVSKPALWMLLIENHKIPFIAENANIAIDIYPDSTSVSGTKANEDFQLFINKSNAHRKQITELYARIQAASNNSEEKALLQKQLEEMEQHWHTQVIVKFIEDNINNPAGQRAFKSLIPDLSINELRNIVANVDSGNTQNPIIQQAVERITTLEEKP